MANASATGPTHNNLITHERVVRVGAYYASSSLMPTMARTAARIGRSTPSGTLGAIKLPATTPGTDPSKSEPMISRSTDPSSQWPSPATSVNGTA